MAPIPIIAAFIALFMRDAIASPLAPRPPAEAALLTVGTIVLCWTLADRAIASAARALDRTGSWRAVDRAQRWLGLSRLIATLAHVVGVLVLGWLDAVRAAVGDLVLVDELIAMLPILACFVMGWWSFARIERRLREATIVRELDRGGPLHPIPTRWGYTLTSARHQLGLTVVPILAIAGWTELVAAMHPRLELPQRLAWTATPIALLGVLAILTLMPAVLRRVWRTTALASGPLRDALTAMCRAHRVRVGELLVWRTDGTLVNAAVIGLLPQIRYILLTDALLEHLPERQVEAVLAHELGHVRRRHMIWLGLIGVGGMLFCASVAQLVLEALLPPEPWSEEVMLGAVVASLAGAILIFGLASRRFEWQADAFAVQHLSGHVPGSRASAPAIRPEAVLAMTGALDAVAHLNHIPRSRFTFRHGSIADRQQRLMALVDRPADRLRPDRDAALVKLSGLALLAAALLAMWALPGQWSSTAALVSLSQTETCPCTS